MKTIITMIVAGFLCLVLLNGCNTVKGVGKDVSNGGRDIQRAVN